MADDGGLFCHACKAASAVEGGGDGAASNAPGATTAAAGAEPALVCTACGSDFVERMPLRTAERRAARAARADARAEAGGGGRSGRGGGGGGLGLVPHGILVEVGPVDSLMDMLEAVMGGMAGGGGGGGR